MENRHADKPNYNEKKEEEKMTLETKAKNAGIGRYRQVADDIRKGKIRRGGIAYVAQTPTGHNYGGYRRGTVRAYVWDGYDFHLLFHNLSPSRAKVAIKNYKSYKAGKISPEVWNNYITGGYSTRAGLFRSKVSTERLRKIAGSHADYLGQERGNSTYQHRARQRLRR